MGATSKVNCVWTQPTQLWDEVLSLGRGYAGAKVEGMQEPRSMAQRVATAERFLSETR